MKTNIRHFNSDSGPAICDLEGAFRSKIDAMYHLRNVHIVYNQILRAVDHSVGIGIAIPVYSFARFNFNPLCQSL